MMPVHITCRFGSHDERNCRSSCVTWGSVKNRRTKPVTTGGQVVLERNHGGVDTLDATAPALESAMVKYSNSVRSVLKVGETED